jgi:nucleotide-binding universal stress UspA family protein
MPAAIRTILVPHDFSYPAQAAFAHAQQLARLADASIHLLHVVNAPMLHAITPSGPVRVALPEAVVLGARLEADRLLRAIANGAAEDVEVHVAEGPPTEVICRVARRVSADLIAMGTHGGEDVADRRLGSVAERTLRQAPCPVLTVRGSPERRGA